MVARLGGKHPGKGLLEISREVLGRPLAWALGGLFSWFFLHFTALLLRDFGEFFVMAVMPETPLLAFEAIALALAVMAASGGLEVIARSAELLFPIIVAAFLAVFLGNVGDLRLNELFPLLSRGLRPAVSGVLTHWPWFGEAVVFAFLAPYFNRANRCYRALALAVLAGGLALMLATASVLAVFGPDLVALLRYPYFRLASLIMIGAFRGAETVFLILWFAVNYLKISLFFLVAALTVQDWLGLGDYRPILFPLAALVLPLSLYLFSSYDELMAFARPTIFAPYALPVEVGLPLLLLLASARRRNR